MTIARRTTHALALPDGRLLVVGNDVSGLSLLRDDSSFADVGSGSGAVWTPASPLNAPRGDFAATALADGRVLVTGGANQGGVGCDSSGTRQSYSSTYLFDPASDTWLRSGLLGTARTAPAIARLPDGRVLVAGGYYRVKPAYGSVPGDGTARLAVARPGRGDGAIDPADVDPPTIGHALATAELFDPATGAWSRTGSLRYARYGAVAVTLADGRVLVAGSEPGSGVAAVAPDAALTAELYDPATGRFTATGRLPAISLSVMFPSRPKWADEFGDPAPYANGTLVPLANGDALLVGNTWWWKHQGEVSRQLRYMAATGTWALAGPAWFDGWTHTDGSSWTSGTSRYDAIAALLADGRVLVAGGSTGIQYEGVVGRSTALYEPATGRWTAGPAMPAPRAGAAAARLPSGDVLVVGGYTSDDDRWQNCEHAGGTAVTLRFAP